MWQFTSAPKEPLFALFYLAVRGEQGNQYIIYLKFQVLLFEDMKLRVEVTALLPLLIAISYESFQGLSKIFSVMEFDFSKPISPCFGKAQVFQSHIVVIICLEHACFNTVPCVIKIPFVQIKLSRLNLRRLGYAMVLLSG